jgi:tetratricopeptide (TPR) repeat protein
MNCRLASLVVVFLLPSATAVMAEEKPWSEVRSPHFRVLTNGSERQARQVAHDFEQLRYVFQSQYPNFRLESGAPLLALAARDEKTDKAWEPRLWKTKGAKPVGDFQPAWEKQYVMVRLDMWDEGAHEVVYHEYAHSILHMNSHWLPVWLDEGIAEFYAYTRFQEQQIYIGAPTERNPVLVEKPLIPVETLIAVDQASPYYHDEDKAEMFYAESWALVHFMTFGPRMEGGKRLDRFFGLLQQGTEQKKAFLEVFGSFKEVDEGLDKYVRKLTFAVGVLKNPPHIDEKEFVFRALSMAETEAELAGFQLSSHDLVAARPHVEQALKDDPKLGFAHEEKGYVHFASGEDAAAMDEFSQAYALDGTLYLSLFAKTMLSPMATSDNPSAQTAFHDALLKVLELNPQFGPAFVQLARLSLRQGDLKKAFGLSRRAEELEPTRAGYHLLTGQILLRMGKGIDAAACAKFVADRWSETDHNEAVELWNNVPAFQRPVEESLSTTTPKDAQTARGTVKSVGCSAQDRDGQDQGWTLTLNRDGQSLTFHGKGFAAGFADTIWYGEDHFSPCHHLEGMRAVVYYRSPSAASYSGDVIEIEIRDDLPAPLIKATGDAMPTKP